MRVSLAAALLLAPLGATWAATPATAAAACEGQEATHVGTQGGTVTGTDGPDVVVTGGAARVETLGGDDLVCVTALPAGRTTRVSDGPGDDVVLAEPGSLGRADVTLGEGEDRLVGGAGPDRVVDLDPAADRIGTREGYDEVVVNGGVIEDRVVLGRDGGQLTLVGDATGEGALFDGTSGRNKLVLPALAGGVRLYGGGVQTPTGFVRWSGFDHVDVASDARVVYPGTGGTTYRRLTVGNLEQADLRYGDTLLEIRLPASGLPQPGTVRGGAGQDELRLIAAPGSRLDGLAVDGRDGEVRIGGTKVYDFVGIEDLAVQGGRDVVVHGSRGDNRILLRACDATASGGPGDDVLHHAPLAPSGARCAGEAGRGRLLGGDGDDVLFGGALGDVLSGGDGADVLWGGPGDDRLYGGTGRDRILGGVGRDLCSGETRLECER